MMAWRFEGGCVGSGVSGELDDGSGFAEAAAAAAGLEIDSTLAGVSCDTEDCWPAAQIIACERVELEAQRQASTSIL